jgi:D-alanine-D-alanine ligase
MNIDPKRYGKVAVLYGGESAERDVSLQSGEAVLRALKEEGVAAEGIDCRGDFLSKLAGFDRAFIALHGRGGEDGTLQGALEVLGIPYTGSGVLASALAMDKGLCKQLWTGVHLPTPQFLVIEGVEQFSKLDDVDAFPVMVKPVREGSSVGMSKVDTASELRQAVTLALRYDSALVERYIQGEEYTVAIVNDKVLPPICLKTPRDFYDYEAKYQSEETEYKCPCGLGFEEEEALKTLAYKAYKSVTASGWGRVDVMRDAAGIFYLLEINTVPGMTSHSLVPMAAKQEGISFNKLVLDILESSFIQPVSGN